MNYGNVGELFTNDPLTAVKTGLRFLHFVGLALGLGGATLLDLMLLRFCLKNQIQPDTVRIFEFFTQIVTVGLRVLWISGLGFLMFYALFEADKLLNPKVHAKLVIVAILSVNGMFIHNVILPALKAQVGKGLFEGFSPVKRTVFVTSGAISVVSWYVPVALGVFSQLNHAVPAPMLLWSYFFLIVSAAFAMSFVAYLVGFNESRPRLLPAVENLQRTHRTRFAPARLVPQA